MFSITLKQIQYGLGIGAFVLSIAASLVINNSLPLIAVAFPLILFNRAFVLSLLLIIPTIEGAFALEAAPITESLSIAGLIPIFVYDILKAEKKDIPVRIGIIYFFFLVFILIGFFVYNEHPEIIANSSRKGLEDVYKKMFMKGVKIIFFFLYLKFLVSKDKDFLQKALNLFKNVIPYLVILILLFLLLKGKAGVKFGQVNFGSSHHGDFTANLCALGVYLYIGLFERNKNLIYKGIFIVALAAMLYVIMQLASRNGLLSFAFISMISVYLVLKNRGIGVKVLVAMLGIIVGIGALYLFQDSPTIQRAIYQTEVKGGGDRLFYWSSGVKAISEEPFFGFGGDETSSLYAVAKYAPEVEDHVMHNTFLEAGVEYGLIGLTFFLILVFTIIRWSYRNFRYAIATDNLILAAPGISYLISIFAGLFISRIWESTLWYNMSLVFAIGILWVYPSKVFSRVNKYQRNFSVPPNFDQKMLT